VVSSADFRALAIEDAWSGGNKGCLVEAPGNGIYFYSEGGDGSGVKDIFGRD